MYRKQDVDQHHYHHRHQLELSSLVLLTFLRIMSNPAEIISLLQGPFLWKIMSLSEFPSITLVVCHG
jgi:hypothetical protein